jgi:hypothetical protein
MRKHAAVLLPLSSSAFVAACRTAYASDPTVPVAELPEADRSSDPFLLSLATAGCEREFSTLVGLMCAALFSRNAQVPCAKLAACTASNDINAWPTRFALESHTHPLYGSGWLSPAVWKDAEISHVALGKAAIDALHLHDVMEWAKRAHPEKELPDLLHEWASRERYDPHPGEEYAAALHQRKDDPRVDFVRSCSEVEIEQKLLLAAAGYWLLSPAPFHLDRALAKVETRVLVRHPAAQTIRSPTHPFYTTGLLDSFLDAQGQVEKVRLAQPIAAALQLPAPPASHQHHPALHVTRPQDIAEIQLDFPAALHAELATYAATLQPRAFARFCARMRASHSSPAFLGMLYGGPGTGKTEWVRQIARSTGRPLVEIELSGLRDMYLGQSEQLVFTLFRALEEAAKAHERAPVVLFDEADGFFSHRRSHAGSETSTETNMKTIFLKELQRFTGIAFATCNHTDHLDAAFERRFPVRVAFPHPDRDARFRMLRQRFPRWRQRELRHLASAWSFTGAQVQNLCIKAHMHGIARNDFGRLESLLSTEIRGWNPAYSPIGYTTPAQ